MLGWRSWSQSIVTIDEGRSSYFLEHLMRLDADARLGRFGRLASDEFLREYTAGLDLSDTTTIIGFFSRGYMRAAAELRSVGVRRARLLAVALSVEKAWQRGGIGTALTMRAIAVARASGASHILVNCIAANEPMRRIVSHLDSELVFEGDECSAWLPLTAPSAPGMALEMLPAAV